MKSRTLRCLEVSTVVLTMGWGWVMLNMEPPATPRRVSGLMATEPRIAERRHSATPETFPLPGTPEFRNRTRERAEKWLEENGRNAASLLGMWDLTGDRPLLNEAADRFPDNPKVCMAMIRAGRNIYGQKGMPWINRLIAAEPDNAEGYYLRAWALAYGGPRDSPAAVLREAETIEALRKAGSLSTPDDHAEDRFDGLRQAAEACGLSEREGTLLAIRKIRDDGLRPAMIKSISRTIEEAMAASEPGVAEYSGSLGLAIAESLPRSPIPTLADQVLANALKLQILPRLRDDAIFGHGDNTSTTRELKAHAEGELPVLLHSGFALRKDEPALLREASDALVIAYGNRFLSDGESNALLWLQNEVVSSRTPAPGP